MSECEFENTGISEEEETPIVLCPICGKPVNNHAAEELFTVDLVESDFRVQTLDDDILDTWLVFCHHCLYVTHDFRQIPEDVQLIKDVIESEDYKNRFVDTNPTTMELFEHFLYMLKRVNASPMVFADTYLRMSWLAEDDRDVDQANEFREKAIINFGKSLFIADLDDKEISMIYYYIAELSRRKGEFDRAKKALMKLDVQIPMIKKLFDMQSVLLRNKSMNAVVMPREE